MGLAAGRYSGTNLPDLYLTPHALHSVFGPIGPALHCGVSSESQCKHFLFTVAVEKSFFFTGFGCGSGGGGAATAMGSNSEDELERIGRRDDHETFAARDRLLRILPRAGVPVAELGADTVPEDDDLTPEMR